VGAEAPIIVIKFDGELVAAAFVAIIRPLTRVPEIAVLVLE